MARDVIQESAIPSGFQHEEDPAAEPAAKLILLMKSIPKSDAVWPAQLKNPKATLEVAEGHFRWSLTALRMCMECTRKFKASDLERLTARLISQRYTVDSQKRQARKEGRGGLSRQMVAIFADSARKYLGQSVNISTSVVDHLNDQPIPGVLKPPLLIEAAEKDQGKEEDVPRESFKRKFGWIKKRS